MRLPGRASAAIEVLDAIERRHQPASLALKDWAAAHRFAGSSDRAAIGNLVHDALRRKNSLAHRMGCGEPRALVLAVLRTMWGLAVDEIAALVEAEHGPGALTGDETARLARAADEDAPAWVRGDYPEWLAPEFERAFAARAVAEGQGLAARAPLDLRVNTLKADRAKAMKALARFGPREAPLSPVGLRIAPPDAAGRLPNVEASPAHGRGWFEVQDAGSQVSSLLTGAGQGHQVADICAGAGGKTLALAAAMRNTGQIYAHDADPHRLRPIHDRLKRAGVRNVQVIGAHEQERLQALHARMDRVVVDAPCSGSGAWRRRPDAKWRLTPPTLARRIAEQREVLAEGARLVKPGGRLAYVTCSVLPGENGDRVAAFLDEHDDFRPIATADVWRETIGDEPPSSADGGEQTLLLSPASHDTDGFFIAVMERAGGSDDAGG